MRWNRSVDGMNPHRMTLPHWKKTTTKNTVVGSNEICSQTRPNSYGNEKFNSNVIYYPRKSKTKHRMVFRMIHVRDSLLYNYQWAKSGRLGLPRVLVGDSHHWCYILSFQVKSWKHTKTYGKKPINASSISIDLCKIWTTTRIIIIVYIYVIYTHTCAKQWSRPLLNGSSLTGVGMGGIEKGKFY